MSASYFDTYEKLARSGLFDAAYYQSANPDVAANNMDPLLHFLEQGAKAGRSPSSRFDLEHYLKQCRAIGEQPENPLLHYLDGGISRGFHISTAARPTSDETDAFRLYIDNPIVEDGIANTIFHDDLAVNGWALARNGVDAVRILVDGQLAFPALYGIHRRDVATEFPNWAGSSRSGFAAVIPYRSFGPGSHEIRVTVMDRAGKSIACRFRIEVGELTDPWQIRDKISFAETKFCQLQLARMRCHPRFVVMMKVAKHEVAAAKRSIDSLRRQPYADWQLLLLTAMRPLAQELSKLDKRIGFYEERRLRFRSENCPFLVGMISAGDELSADALLQFAISSGRRHADFFYADDWRINRAGRGAAYLKPDWSPDLLHATNYIGSPWFANATLFDRIAFDPVHDRGFDLVLKCTELATTIAHIPIPLCQHTDPTKSLDDRRALNRVLSRTGIDGEILPGLVNGHYRLKRRLTVRPLVSIIIPTCGARELVKQCIKSIRAMTRYRPIEIVGIENISDRDRTLKDWVHANTDNCIATTEQFNWSRFNNLAAAAATGEYFLFLNDDTEVIDPEWLDALMEQALRPDIGVVGPLLLYPDKTIQHAGVFIAAGAKGGRHFFRCAKTEPGYFGWALTMRNVSAVTGACLMTRKATFEALGRFDEHHGIINNDVDYCLRALRRGMRNIYTPHSKLIHHELASRSELPESYNAARFGREWREILFSGDRYYHPALVRDSDMPEPDKEPVEIIYPGRPLLDRHQVRRVLLVKLDHIGDTITALPAARRLRETFPDAQFYVLAAATTASVWARQDFVREVIEFDFFHSQSSRGMHELAPGTLNALETRLRTYEFDLAVDLRKHLETRPILRRTGAKFLAGFDHDHTCAWLDIALEWEGDRKGAPKRQHVADDLLDLAGTIAATCRDHPPSLPPRRTRLPSFAPHGHVNLFDRAVVCLHPGVGADIRQWPTAYFSALADRLIERDEVHVAIVGGRDDVAIATDFVKRIEHKHAVWNLVGKLSLDQLRNLLARCALFVGNNSGPQHIAAELGIPTIGIHSGQVDPKEWGPLGPLAVAIRRRVSCAPCYLERAADCPREMACLNKLLPGDVYRLCNTMLASVNPSQQGQAR